MKPQRQISMATKLLSSAARGRPHLHAKKLCVPSASSAVVAKLRELWEGLTGGGGIFAAARRPGAGGAYYFRGSYELSCTATRARQL